MQKSKDKDSQNRWKDNSVKDLKAINVVYDKEFEEVYLSRSKSKDNSENDQTDAAPNGITCRISKQPKRDQNTIYQSLMPKPSLYPSKSKIPKTSKNPSKVPPS